MSNTQRFNTCSEAFSLFSVNDIQNIVKQSYTYVEVMRKMGMNDNLSYNFKQTKKYLAQLDIDTSHFTHLKSGYVHRTSNNIFVADSDVEQPSK